MKQYKESSKLNSITMLQKFITLKWFLFMQVLIMFKAVFGKVIMMLQD